MKKPSLPETTLVYSSELGRICSGCGEAKASCLCSKKSSPAVGDGIVRIMRESKGRGGKTVTVIKGLPLEERELQKLAGELKRRCGSGGTTKDGVIEIQGDHRDLLLSELGKKGFMAKKAGG
ncbi:MAG: translation initiation factor Sui1 [Deltaproteobacteria bacterium]